MLTVTRLFYYPVKSLGGVEASALALTRRGPRWDREWMLVGADGVFLSQRTVPKMARIQPALTDDALRLTAGGESFSVPLTARGPSRRVKVWSREGAALDEGDAAAARLSGFLGLSCRLVRAVPGAECGFSDDSPLLLVSEDSLADLGRRAGRPFEVERFRPNLVVKGAAPWAEDGWRALRAKGLTLRCAKPCVRCAITTYDPVTGAAGPEPLKTLASFRRGAEGVEFGVNCAPEGEGRLAVGSLIQAL